MSGLLVKNQRATDHRILLLILPRASHSQGTGSLHLLTVAVGTEATVAAEAVEGICQDAVAVLQVPHHGGPEVAPESGIAQDPQVTLEAGVVSLHQDPQGTHIVTVP